MAGIEKNPLDNRVRELNLKRGRITRQDIDKHIESLPDDSAWATEHVVYEEEKDDSISELSLDEASTDPFAVDPENT